MTVNVCCLPKCCSLSVNYTKVSFNVVQRPKVKVSQTIFKKVKTVHLPHFQVLRSLPCEPRRWRRVSPAVSRHHGDFTVPALRGQARCATGSGDAVRNVVHSSLGPAEDSPVGEVRRPFRAGPPASPAREAAGQPVEAHRAVRKRAALPGQ